MARSLDHWAKRVHQGVSPPSPLIHQASKLTGTSIGSCGSYLDGGTNVPFQEAAIPMLEPSVVHKEMVALQKHFCTKASERTRMAAARPETNPVSGTSRTNRRSPGRVRAKEGSLIPIRSIGANLDGRARGVQPLPRRSARRGGTGG